MFPLESVERHCSRAFGWALEWQPRLESRVHLTVNPKSCDGPEDVSCLWSSKSACCCFQDAGRSNGAPGIHRGCYYRLYMIHIRYIVAWFPLTHSPMEMMGKGPERCCMWWVSSHLRNLKFREFAYFIMGCKQTCLRSEGRYYLCYTGQ